MSALIIIFAVICVLILLLLFLISPAGYRPSVKPFLGKYYAHRGIFDNKTIPENSLPAFEKAKEKAISTISQYRTDVFASMIKLRIEMDNKDFIGLPHEQESEIYEEIDESLKYIDKLMEKIKEIEFE